MGPYSPKNLTVGDFNSYFFGTLRESTLKFERFFSWCTTLYLNLIGGGVVFENEHLDQLEFPGRDPGLQGWPSGAE